MGKRRFTFAQRYAVWHCHERRCWLCTEPLRVQHATIDHFFSESLLDDDVRRKHESGVYGLTDAFNIDSFSNWLPAHPRCNQVKGDRTPPFVPGNVFVLQQLIDRAPLVERTAKEILSNIQKDKVFARVATAVERDTITLDDLRSLIEQLAEEPAPSPNPEDIVLLEGGYWVHRRDIARECVCTCERNRCVDSNGKVYCYFRPDLSPWVITSGLYWKCYDELIDCPRCEVRHKRGHVGKLDVCARPFVDQDLRAD